MVESRTRTIELVDVNADTVEAFIKYLYTDRFDFVDSISCCNVLALAKKYAVDALRETCIQAVIKNITVENVAFILRTAHLLDLPSVKVAGIHFVVKDSSTRQAVEDTEDFDALPREVLRELFSAVSVKRCRGGYEFTGDTVWQDLTTPKLRRACFERRLPSDGDKSALVARLVDEGGRGETSVSDVA